jgi:hypothetical protein
LNARFIISFFWLCLAHATLLWGHANRLQRNHCSRTVISPQSLFNWLSLCSMDNCLGLGFGSIGLRHISSTQGFITTSSHQALLWNFTTTRLS